MEVSMSMSVKSPESEWSVIVRVDDVPSNGKAMELAPNQGEKKALAGRLNILELQELKAKVQLNRQAAHILHVKGKFDAKIKQACVVTLEPIETVIKDEFEAWFADEKQAISFKKAQHEAQTKKELLDLPILDESEAPEPMENGEIDVGDIIAQFLSLAIPPYPHKEGIEYENVEPEEPKLDKNPMKVNPFAALKNWRPKD